MLFRSEITDVSARVKHHVALQYVQPTNSGSSYPSCSRGYRIDEGGATMVTICNHYDQRGYRSVREVRDSN